MPIFSLRRLSLLLGFSLLSAAAHAENWPQPDWQSQPAPASAAITELETYAFTPRDDAERKGVRTDALLVIEVQEDFIPPHGALAVRGGDEVVGVCSDVMRAFDHVVFSQDYHPEVRASGD